MEIKSLFNSANIYKENNVANGVKKQPQDTVQNTQKDKLEISAEAKKLESIPAKNMESAKTVKNLQEIQEKVRSGYYNSDEVINKVAEKILKEIAG